MSGTKPKLVLAQVPNPTEYATSLEVWEALSTEIQTVTARINAKEELVPEDVEKIKQLKKQVDTHVTAFNKAMGNAQTAYKNLITQQLNEIGYPVIEAYIQTQRKKQTDSWNAKILEKQRHLASIVAEKLEATSVLKTTVIANQLLPAFVHRFPKVNSAAKNNEINDWSAYEALIGTTLNIVDVFFNDPAYKDAVLLPISSVTNQQLLAYVRDGNLEHLNAMRENFSKDARLLKMEQLKREITTKEIAISKIESIMAQTLSADEKISEIARIIRIAESL